MQKNEHFLESQTSHKKYATQSQRDASTAPGMTSLLAICKSRYKLHIYLLYILLQIFINWQLLWDKGVIKITQFVSQAAVFYAGMLWESGRS